MTFEELAFRSVRFLMKHREREIQMDCPFCSKEGHLYVNRRSGLWHCFRCKEGGRLDKLIAQVWGVPIEEVQRLVREESYDLSANIAEMRWELERKIGDALSPAGAPTPVPLPPGLPALDVPAAARYLAGRGVNEATAQDAGLLWCGIGRYRGRVVFPVADLQGRPLTWIARSIGARNPKYLFPSGPSKSSTLYRAPQGSEVVLVEGVLDALVWAGQGVPAAAVMGSSLSEAQRGAAARYERVTVAFDGDDAGRQGAHDAATRLLALVPEVRVAVLPDGRDPGDTDPGDVLPGKVAGRRVDLSREYTRRER